MKVYKSYRFDSSHIFKVIGTKEEIQSLSEFGRNELSDPKIPIISFSETFHIKLDDEEDRVKFAIYAGLDIEDK